MRNIPTPGQYQSNIPKKVILNDKPVGCVSRGIFDQHIYMSIYLVSGYPPCLGLRKRCGAPDILNRNLLKRTHFLLCNSLGIAFLLSDALYRTISWYLVPGFPVTYQHSAT